MLKKWNDSNHCVTILLHIRWFQYSAFKKLEEELVKLSAEGSLKMFFDDRSYDYFHHIKNEPYNIAICVRQTVEYWQFYMVQSIKSMITKN